MSVKATIKRGNSLLPLFLLPNNHYICIMLVGITYIILIIIVGYFGKHRKFLK